MSDSWKVYRIGDIAQVVGGSTPPTADPSNFDGDIPWLTPKDLSVPHDRYISRGERNLTRKGLASCSAQLLPPGTVLLSSRAPVGYVAIAKNPIATNQGFRSLISRPGFVPEFIYYWLKSNVDELERHASGSTFKELSGGSLKQILIRVPEEQEQRAIAHILGTLDDKIELNRRLNRTLEELARALFHSWFVAFDPVRAKAAGRPPAGMDAETAALFPDSFAAQGVPLGWRVGRVGDIAEIVRRSINPAEHPNEEFDHYSLPAFDNGMSPVRERGASIRSNKTLLQGSSVLISKLNPHIPRVWLPDLAPNRRSICSTEFLVVAPTRAANRAFVYSLLTSDPFTRNFAAMVTGTTGSHQRVRPESFLAMPVVIPPRPVMDRYAEMISPLLDRVLFNIQEIPVLSELRDTLLPRLLSGELSVAGFEGVSRQDGRDTISSPEEVTAGVGSDRGLPRS